MSQPETEFDDEYFARRRSVILPPFEVDCSTWMADTVPQQTGSFVQISRIYGPPEADDGVDHHHLGQLVASMIPAICSEESRPAAQIQQWLDLVGVVLRRASSEVGRVQVDEETAQFRDAVLHDLQVLTQGLDVAMNRIPSAAK